MISINKQGNAIVIEFTDNDKYLFNGKIEVAPNELIVVVDQSDMVTFKRASNGDVLFSQLVDDIQIAGSPVTKDTVIDQFAIIGFTSGGGGGEPGAVSSVNGQTGDVIITPASLNVYTRAEVDAAINAETTERQKQDSALGGMIAAETAARERAVASKQDTLVSGQNIKTINGESILGEGNIEIQGGTSNWDDITGKPEFAEVATSGSYNDLSDKPTIPDVSNLATKAEIADMETKSHAAATYATKAEIPSLDGYLTETEASETYATKEQVSSKQDQLVSGTNIKTINGQTLLGEGNIEIQGGSGGISDAPSDNKLYGRKNGNWSEVIIPSQSRTWRFTWFSSITSGDLASITPDGFNSQEWLSQVAIGDMVYLKKGQEFMKLSVSNIYHPTTGNTTVGLSFYSDRLYWIYVVGNSFSLNIYTISSSGETSNATSFGNGAAVTADSSYGVAIGNNAKSNGYNAIVIGNNISEDEQLSINIGDYLKVSYANGFSYWDGTQMQSLKDQLASLTPPTVDTEMSDTSENAVQNKVIKKYIDDLVGNILTQLQEINGTN